MVISKVKNVIKKTYLLAVEGRRNERNKQGEVKRS